MHKLSQYISITAYKYGLILKKYTNVQYGVQIQKQVRGVQKEWCFRCTTMDLFSSVFLSLHIQKSLLTQFPEMVLKLLQQALVKAETSWRSGLQLLQTVSIFNNPHYAHLSTSFCFSQHKRTFFSFYSCSLKLSLQIKWSAPFQTRPVI